MKDETITVAENNRLASDEKELEIFSKYFGNIVQNLRADGLTSIFRDNTAVYWKNQYQNHPSIDVMRENIDPTNN